MKNLNMLSTNIWIQRLMVEEKNNIILYTNNNYAVS